MRQRRVSMNAALAYWIGNPMLNPATLVFMGFVLGWHWTALRLVTALVMVFGVSYLAARLAVGHSLLLGLWLAVAGTLFVIPTAGEIPIVQGLLAYGLGPFGAGTLLITLPAVSLPSLVMIGRSFPRRTLAMVTLAVVVLGIVSGAVASLLGF
jgi:uncharacterized membrane protein YraQ (UPF0718 family)